MLGKQDQKRAEIIGDEEEKARNEGVEKVFGEARGGVMDRWRNANRWWRYAKI